MAEQEQASPPKSKSWLKALLGTLGGLLSGAIVMYVTPLVDKVVKPPKPVANFAAQENGCEVRFHNLSQHGSGRWDFGDGSPLINTEPDQFVDHTFPRPGDYTVKLTVQNLLGDKDERAVPIHVDGATAPAAVAPKVVSLQATPISAGSYAPATFRLAGKIEHAELTVLDLGDERLPHMAEHIDTVDELVTLDKPGSYKIKLAAFNGSAVDQKTTVLTVLEAPANSLTAVLTVTDRATQQETKTHPAFFNAVFPTNSRDATCPIKCDVKARPGTTLVDLTVKTTDGKELRLGNQADMSLDPAALGLAGARNLRLHRGDDHQTVTLTGELVADRKTKNASLPALMLPVTLTVQKKAPVNQTIPMTTTLNIPAYGAFSSGSLQLPSIPKDWVDCQRQFHLTVLNNGVKVYDDSQLQHSAMITLPTRKLILNTSRTGDQVRLDLMDAPTGAPA